MIWLDGLAQDARHAVRTLRRSPGYAFTAIGMLALGIGVNATVFTIAYSVLFKGFPLVEDNDGLVYLSVFTNSGVSYPEFEDWRAQAASFDGMELVHGTQQVFSEDGDFPETFVTTEVTAGTFALVGRAPILGRDFAPSDMLPGAEPVAILSHELWERRYAQDPSALGQSVRLDGVPTVVIGVMPKGFSFPQNQDLWVPKTPTPAALERSNRDNWFAVARLAAGATLASARAEMATIGRRLEAAYPDTHRGVSPRVQTFREFFIGPKATMIYAALLGAVTFVLLIACANLANLLLARAMARSREISVRVALGAGRGRVVRQLLLESLLLAALGGIAGCALAEVAVRVFALLAHGPSLSDTIGGDWFDGMTDYSLDGSVLAYVVAVSIATGLLFGLAPARRLGKLDVNSALKDGARGASGARGKQLSALLLTAEVALAIVMLVGAGVMVRSFLNVYSADLGMRMTGLSGALLRLPEPRYPNAAARGAFFADLETRLTAAPEIDAITVASALPTQRVRSVRYEIDGAPPTAMDGGSAANAGAVPRPPDERNPPTVGALAIGPAYFRTLEAPLLAGRELEVRDAGAGAPVAVVNERFAAAMWPGESALGRRFRVIEGDTGGEWRTVVGVAPDVAQNDATRQRKEPLVYLPLDYGAASSVWIVARGRAAVAGAADALRREVRALDATLPFGLGPFALDDYLAWNYQYRGTSGALFLACAAIALLLASLGLYAVISYSLSQQTREIGVRIAIGATARDILALVFRQGMTPLAIGLAAGLAAAFGVNRLLASLLVGVSPADPLTLAGSCAALVVAAAVGCWLPARRALRVDPVVALRQE